MNKETKSTYDIGQKIDIKLNDSILTDCYIRAIIFTNMKVRYSIFIKHDQTTIHNVDSIVVIQSYNEYMDFGDDNYS